MPKEKLKLRMLLFRNK